MVDSLSQSARFGNADHGLARPGNQPSQGTLARILRLPAESKIQRQATAPGCVRLRQTRRWQRPPSDQRRAASPAAANPASTFPRRVELRLRRDRPIGGIAVGQFVVIGVELAPRPVRQAVAEDETAEMVGFVL